jgi:ATP-dependent Clp protease ATP-binding subunit ClpC
MVEHYTEKVLQIISFAKDEANQLGSSQIETQDLLLGLLRQDSALISRMSPGSQEFILAELELRTTQRNNVAPQESLPFSNESKRVLAYASEEAAVLREGLTDSRHLLVGLLREEDSFAAKLLRKYKLELSKASTRDFKPTPGARVIAFQVRNRIR